MLLFGSIAPGGGSGAQLWQLNGAAPADIELNTGAGALGIYAELTTNPLYKLILANLGGNDVFAAGYIDFINNVFTAVNAQLGAAALQHVDNINNIALSFDFDANIPNPDALITVSVGGDSTQQQFTSAIIKQKITVGGVDAMFTELNNRFFEIQNQFGAATFKIRRNGAIDTNQTVASIAPRIKTHEMPIHDISGAVVGYIDIKN
jgi:hypothetical protein